MDANVFPCFPLPDYQALQRSSPQNSEVLTASHHREELHVLRSMLYDDKHHNDQRRHMRCRDPDLMPEKLQRDQPMHHKVNVITG